MIIGSADDAFRVLTPFFALEANERVAVIHLARDKRLLAMTLEDSGRHDLAELPIGSIVGNALRLSASSIIVAHNHPSGNPEPSTADKTATLALAAAASAVDIRLHDHIIFGGGSCRSFRKLGLL